MNRITLFRTTPRIVMGPGAIGQIAQEVLGLKAEKVLIVTDKGLIDAGLVKRAQESLEKSQIKYAIFDAVESDPRYEISADCVDMIKSEKADVVIGFGGGSPIDPKAGLAHNNGPHNGRHSQRSNPHCHPL